MKIIKLTQGKMALVDDEDYEYLSQFKWHVVFNKTDYYAVRWTHGSHASRKSVFMHREIMETTKGMEVDHIDHNTLNNQKYNLRNCTHQQNKRNTRKRENKASSYLGVEVRKTKNGTTFRAHIKVNNKSIKLGNSKNEKEAAVLYDKAAIKYFGEYANLNFPNGC